MKATQRYLFAGILMTVIGCTGATTDQPTGGEPVPGSTAASPAESADPAAAEPAQKGSGQEADEGTADVTVRIADENEFREALEQCEGKVVLVDFWALWCAPCVKLFSHTVDLHEKLAERGLAVISVNFDDPGDEQRVLEFLSSNGATCQNFISRYGVGPKTFEAFEITSGNIPYFKLYDRSGQLRKTLGDTQQSIEPSDVDQAVEELLDEA